MEKILISRCLLGEKVRYDGEAKFCDHPLIKQWLAEGRIVAVCPEVEGGLPVPRAAAEIHGLGGGEAVLENKIFIQNKLGQDVTQEFILGAQKALKLIKEHNIKVAILKERSPSCGSSEIYDGNFNKQTIPGAGVTTSLLRQHGVRVFSEEQIDLVAAFL